MEHNNLFPVHMTFQRDQICLRQTDASGNHSNMLIHKELKCKRYGKNNKNKPKDCKSLIFILVLYKITYTV